MIVLLRVVHQVGFVSEDQRPPKGRPGPFMSSLTLATANYLLPSSPSFIHLSPSFPFPDPRSSLPISPFRFIPNKVRASHHPLIHFPTNKYPGAWEPFSGINVERERERRCVSLSSRGNGGVDCLLGRCGLEVRG